jgi:magnesium chelatase family protein
VVANAALPAWRLDDVAAVDRAATRLIERALRAGRLTGRGLGGVRRVARTIADLAGHVGPLGVEHVSTALALRADPLCFDWRVA